VKISFRGTEYIGYLVAPPKSAGRRPMIMVVHNFQGLKFFDVHQAEYFARVGYVGLAVDLYDRTVLPLEERVQPEDKEKLMEWIGKSFQQMVSVDHDFPKVRGLMQAWLEAGLKHETVDPSLPPAAIGYCFGGAVVIECARGGLNLGGIVSLHGLLQGGADPNPMKYCQIERPPLITCDNVYNKNTVLLVENGVEDELVQPDNIASLIAEFEAAGVDWRFYNHGQGCGHGFALPKSLGLPGCLHEKGDRRATMNMLNMFKEIFPLVPQLPVAHNAAGTSIPHLPQAPSDRSLKSQYLGIIVAAVVVVVGMQLTRLK